MTGALIVGALALGLLAVVLAPLGRTDGNPEARSDAAEAEARRRDALTALVDLRAEHDMGKLSDEDFEALRAEYEARLLDALDELERLEIAAPGPDDLEAEIAAMRRRLECPSCGAARRPGERCPSCGA